LLNYVDDEKNVSDYIAGVHDGEILKIVDTLIQKQSVNLVTKELLSHNTLIQQMDDLDRVITKSGRFIGYAITPRESNSIKITIDSVGFMSSAADSFTLYLFDTSHKAAIESKTITTDSIDTIKWTDLGWDVYFDREAGSAGQHYIIGYFEDDVTANLYDFDWTGNRAHMAQKVFGRYSGCVPVRFNNGTLNGVNIPNMKYLVSSQNCRTSGFNLRFNAKCDITRVLADNITMFGEALQYKIAIRVLQDALAYATLNNVTNAGQLRNTWNELIVEYRGQLNGGVTESGKYIPGIMDKLSFDFSSIDAVCLKNQAGKVRNVKF